MHDRARVIRPASGLAGFFAFFFQLFASGPTVDFHPVDDTYQADEVRQITKPILPKPVTTETGLVPTKTLSTQPLYKTRYRERTRFDGRGGIVDLRT
jgi:hypothetical protein